jgi:hypothetical protein
MVGLSQNSCPSLWRIKGVLACVKLLAHFLFLNLSKSYWLHYTARHRTLHSHHQENLKPNAVILWKILFATHTFRKLEICRKKAKLIYSLFSSLTCRAYVYQTIRLQSQVTVSLLLLTVIFPSLFLWQNSVGIATRLRAEWLRSRGSIPSRGKRFFSSI